MDQSDSRIRRQRKLWYRMAEPAASIPLAGLPESDGQTRKQPPLQHIKPAKLVLDNGRPSLSSRAGLTHQRPGEWRLKRQCSAVLNLLEREAGLDACDRAHTGKVIH